MSRHYVSSTFVLDATDRSICNNLMTSCDGKFRGTGIRYQKAGEGSKHAPVSLQASMRIQGSGFEQRGKGMELSYVIIHMLRVAP